MFVFVCGILRDEAIILFAQIGDELESYWDWHGCSLDAANFFIDSWSESGNAEGIADTLCSFMPFPRVVSLCMLGGADGWPPLRVLMFCRRFSKAEAPDEIHLEVVSYDCPVIELIKNRALASLPNLKSLDFSGFEMDVEFAHELFQSFPDFTSLTKLSLKEVPKITDWGIVAEALASCKTLETVECIMLGETGDGWAWALDAALCADTPLSSVHLTMCGPMSKTGLQALDKLLLNKSLTSVSVKVDGDMSYSLAVTLSRALAGQAALKDLKLRVTGKLSFCCANLIERGIVKNNSLSESVVSLDREFPVNLQIVENLNVRLTDKSTVTLEIYPNTFRQVTAHDFRDICADCVNMYGFFEQKSVTLNLWSFRESLIEQISVLCVCCCRGRYVTLSCCHPIKSICWTNYCQVPGVAC